VELPYKTGRGELPAVPALPAAGGTATGRDAGGARGKVSHNMPWESRARGGRYYTRTRRVGGGRRVREYIGRGELAELFARVDYLLRAEREAKRADARARIAEFDDLDGLVEVLSAAATREMRRQLTAAGLHQHNRGEWRRRRATQAERQAD
jgi:hypothetical protein